MVDDSLRAIQERCRANAATITHDDLKRIRAFKREHPAYTNVMRCLDCNGGVCVNGSCYCCKTNKLTINGTRVNTFAGNRKGHESVGTVADVLTRGRR